MPPTNPSGVSSGPPQNVKKDRGVIAAQACDTCRARKHRCDEQRPRCGHCQRMKLECHYREVQPTKKDRTLVEILDRLICLEGKIDRISPFPSQRGFGPLQVVPASQVTSPFPIGSVRQSQGGSPNGTGPPNKYTSATHRVLLWPSIQEIIQQTHLASSADIHNPQLDGPAFLVRLQRGSQVIPLDETLVAEPFVGMQMQATRKTGGLRVRFPDLDYNTMHELATSYFDTFNLIYPFMDRQNFISDTLAKVHSEGFDGDVDSVIALLIFALGELAMQGTRGKPVEFYNGRPSGLRGGTLQKPPGLGLFNEARNRVGYVVADMELENVQIFLLSAFVTSILTFEPSPPTPILLTLHQAFLRGLLSACRILENDNSGVNDLSICDHDVSLNSGVFAVGFDNMMPGTLLIGIRKEETSSSVHTGTVGSRKRRFIMSLALQLELGLPLTSVQSNEDFVDLPAFISPFCESDHHSNEMSHFEKHYEAQIALHHLLANLNYSVNEASSTNMDTPATSEDIRGSTPSDLKQLNLQLDQWRSMLPPELKWPEDDPTVFPESTNVPRPYFQPLDPSLTASPERQPHAPLFNTDVDQEPEQYPFVYDIQVAFLRTRFYYAKYIVNRPFVYKALHFPDQMTPTDMQGVENCLKSCLKWPVLLSPTSRKKRCIPHLFCWTQAFFGILLILHLSQHVPSLRKVREVLGDAFESDAADSVELMLDWIRDLKDSDPFADFCYQVLEGIYSKEPSNGDEMEDE